MDSMFDALERIVKELQAGPTSREVSIALTHLQTAILWLRSLESK